MHQTYLRRTLLLVVASTVFAPISHSQPRGVALTIDDAPHNGPVGSLGELSATTKKFIDTLTAERVPAVVFVNEGQIFYKPEEVEEKIAILRSWAESGYELGNHTFGHLGLKDTPLDAFQDDFIRGEVISRRIANETGTPLRYFRHPFLQMGSTREIEDRLDGFLARRGYRSVPITLTTEDWIFASAYRKASNQSERKRVSEDYIRFAKADVEYRDQAVSRMFGRPTSHILLVHANAVTADNLARLIGMYRSLGYKFVTVDEALKDPIFSRPEQYASTSDWLRAWSISKSAAFDPPQPPEYIKAASRNP